MCVVFLSTFVEFLVSLIYYHPTTVRGRNLFILVWWLWWACMSIASGLTVVTISSLPFSETWTAVRVSVWYYLLFCLSFSVLSRMPESVSPPQSALSCSRRSTRCCSSFSRSPEATGVVFVAGSWISRASSWCSL